MPPNGNTSRTVIFNPDSAIGFCGNAKDVFGTHFGTFTSVCSHSPYLLRGDKHTMRLVTDSFAIRYQIFAM
jgi:hypothetical protein